MSVASPGNGTGVSALYLPLPTPGTVHQPLIILVDDSASSEDMHAPLLHGTHTDSMDVVHALAAYVGAPPVIRPASQVGSVVLPGPLACLSAAALSDGPLAPYDMSAFTTFLSLAAGSDAPPHLHFFYW